ncbi:uncharacterized protein LOC129582982 [Paramacrobiotus metropolitanus]|uniref:uncharacterized protein LOC129582982 n=1 Tax=Paramacrobiotus metropolitanus TaxID=2943436 RepID=UPI0024460816|nr:uncharacterized protein LOC129582982 [Paramacrobiotus metropolitanus]
MASLEFSLLLVALLAVVSRINGYDGSYEEEVDAEHDAVQFPKETMNTAQAKAEYDQLVMYSQIPTYGSCWSEALENLHHNCKKLTEGVQKQLAFDFASCFLKKTGADKVKCLPEQDLSECAANHSQNFFTSFVHFFTNTQSVCFHISSEIWQKRAERQVLRLMDASHVVTGRLEEARTVQTLLLEQQKSALGNAEEIRLWIGNIADKIAHLQNVFIDEFTGFYSLIFYFVSTAACFILTATRRTSGARFWIFLLLVATFGLERFYTKTKLAALEGLASSDTINRELSADAWMIRRMFWIIAAAILVYFAYAFVDINQINTEMIREIRAMLERGMPVSLPGLNHLNGDIPAGNGGVKESLMGFAQKGRDVFDGVREKLGRRPLSEYDTVSPRRSVTPARERSMANGPRTNGHNLPPLAESDREDSPVREGSFDSRRTSRETTPLRSPAPYNLRSASLATSPAANASAQRHVRSRSLSREPTPERNHLDLVDLKKRLEASGTRNGLATVHEENGQDSD